MKNNHAAWIVVFLLSAFFVLPACRVFNPAPPAPSASPSAPPAPTITIPASVTLQPHTPDTDEPVYISGEIPYTSPFFLSTTAEPFVMLEDQAGFVRRDREFQFSLPSQIIGPVHIDNDQKLSFSLSLPMIPQATYLDVDNDGEEDTGLQIFAIAYWSNTWGDPFLERRDGTGWSNAYASTITDPENDYEITGGTLVIWSPDDKQGFPTDFGEDGKLFTADDPTALVPAGYSLVDLNEKPFRIYKESRPVLTLIEGATAVNDYSAMDYAQAFSALFDKASREYPFTDLKRIQWAELREKYLPMAEKVRSQQDFYHLLRQFTLEIPDGHVGLSLEQQAFYSEYGGGFGLVLAELSDGRIIAKEVLPDLPAAKAGIQAGAEILTWAGKPVAETIQSVAPGFAPYSSQHALRLAKINFLTRVQPGSRYDVQFKNPGDNTTVKSVQLTAANEYDSLFKTIPSFNEDKMSLPIEAYTLPDTNLGYIRISTFQDDQNLMARLWDRYIQNMLENDVPGVIIDIRANSGGSLGMAMDFAGYFFKEEITLYQNYYYNQNSGQFESTGYPTRIRPAPHYYGGVVAILVGPDCVSACEGFAYAMQHNGRATIVGHYPTAGAFGEVGQGQYKLPGDLTMQFPTGRSVTPDGEIVIEGRGVAPDIVVPVTEDSALGRVDTVLQAAMDTLLKELR